MNPACMIQCDSSAGNHTMDVGMEQQVLSPGVKNAKEANLRPKVFRIACNLHQRFGHSAEQ